MEYSVSRAPKNPWGGFGPDDGPGRALRLVEVPDVRPARPQWFSFRAALLVAMACVGLGAAVGLATRLTAYVEEHAAEEASPVIFVESAPELKEHFDRVSRHEVVMPVAPQVVVEDTMEYPRPESPPGVPVEMPPEEPFEVAEVWEAAREPFPEISEEPPPKVVRRSSPPASSRPSSRPPAPRPTRVQASVVKRIPPVYPGTARREGIEGRVVVHAAVATNGSVSSVRLASSSGSSLLDTAAMSAVKRWSFSPETLGGRPVPSAVRVPVLFQLR